MYRSLTTANLIRTAVAGGLVVALLATVVGCAGGVGSGSTPGQATTTVIVETLQQGTTDLLPVAADITVGGVTAKVDMVQGWAVITGVPLGDKTPPEQPLTVSAHGWTTVSQILTLSTFSYTSISVSLAPADPATTGDLEGEVTATGGSPALVNAAVTVSPAVGSPLTAYTDRAGRFKLTGVPAGRATVMAQATGYMEASQELTVRATAAGANPPLRLFLLSGTTKLTVTGQVLHVGADTPIAGAQVQIGELPTVVSAADGSFSVPLVQVGAQTLRASAPGYDTRQQQITVEPGMAPVLVYLVPTAPDPPGPPFTISGHVTLRGRPDNSGATVTAFHRTLGEVLDTATTDASGNYFLFVPPGPYRITVQYGARTIASDVNLLGGGRVLTGVDFELSVTG